MELREQSEQILTRVQCPYLPAATKLGQGNIFTGVCLSTGGGVCFSACWDIPPGPDPPNHPPGSKLQHTVNERPVRILLECILVYYCPGSSCTFNHQICILLLFLSQISQIFFSTHICHTVFWPCFTQYTYLSHTTKGISFSNLQNV